MGDSDDTAAPLFPMCGSQERPRNQASNSKRGLLAGPIGSRCLSAGPRAAALRSEGRFGVGVGHGRRGLEKPPGSGCVFWKPRGADHVGHVRGLSF